MRSLAAFLLLAFATGAFSAALELSTQWEAFKVEHGKQYASVAEEQHRMDIFAEHVRSIAEHNQRFEQGLVSYTQKINQFSDLTFSEFAQQYLTFNLTSLDLETEMFEVPTELGAPTAMDWRSKGAVTRVKNQGSCGSCWAFSSTGALESQVFKKTGKLEELSEQQLVDCSTANKGCKGGLMSRAYNYIKRQGGINSEKAYPYEAVDSTCRFKPNAVAAKVSGYKKLPETDEGAMKEAVGSVGPVAIAIRATRAFHHYHSGVFFDDKCAGDLNHAVLAVGYDKDPKDGDYWIVKNSWDASWGDKGYIKMARNRNNQCGVASFAVYPLVK